LNISLITNLSKKTVDKVQFDQKKCPLLELRGMFFGTGAQAKSLKANAPQPSTEIVTRRGEIISRRGEMASRHWEIVKTTAYCEDDNLGD
jgi:hypothetical protein